jgi:hypothetical protein
VCTASSAGQEVKKAVLLNSTVADVHEAQDQIVKLLLASLLLTLAFALIAMHHQQQFDTQMPASVVLETGHNASVCISRHWRSAHLQTAQACMSRRLRGFCRTASSQSAPSRSQSSRQYTPCCFYREHPHKSLASMHKQYMISTACNKHHRQLAEGCKSNTLRKILQ